MKYHSAFKLLFIFVLLSLQVYSQKQPANQATVKSQDALSHTASSRRYPVAPFRDTLFYVYNKIGAFTPEKRAKAIEDRIRQIYSDPLFEADSLRISPADISLDIVYKGNFIILSITTTDANSENLDSQTLAEKRKTILAQALQNEKANNASLLWLQRIGLALLFLTVVLLLLYGITILFKKLMFYLMKNDERFFKGVLLNNYHILTPRNQLFFTLKFIKFIRLVVHGLLIYLSLPLLFSVFPSTVGYTTKLMLWILKPAKYVLSSFLDYLPNLFSIVIIYLVFQYLVKILRFFVIEIQKGKIKINGFYSDWAKPTFNIVRVLLYAFMLVIIFPYLPGSDSPIFKGVTVFVGVLFSIGSSNAIANMVAGLVITYMRPFKTGDFIKIGDVSGEVIEKTALVVRIRTPKMEDITIPNATVLSSSSINFSANTDKNTLGLVVHSTVTIGYDVPWRDVHKALIQAATQTDWIEKEPLPFVLQTSLDDFYVSYQINAYTKEAKKQPVIYSSLHQNIQDSFNEAGIEIMSPHYNALRDGNQTTIPEAYLAKDYKPSEFRVTNGQNGAK
ncbi:mechanosensitive ion channel family protein [Flavobacterium sp. TSSA_36]|uniref:mechanosensitive ion channel family protein n=1 Tax=Flavobacterium sp. TSSA_36 TaxID=3447669 RepID=UPI003F37F851